MNVRTIIKNNTKRVGRAFGTSDILDVASESKDLAKKIDANLNTYSNDFWNFSFPFITITNLRKISILCCLKNTEILMQAKR